MKFTVTFQVFLKQLMKFSVRCLTETLLCFKTGIHLDGRKLQVTLALSREKTKKMIQEQKTVQKEYGDKRNLYLAREGVIISGSHAAVDLSKEDILKRERAEAEKKSKLKNPNYFVSTSRYVYM